MLRKILIAVVASLSLLSPLALPAISDANPPIDYHRHDRHDRDYRLYVRECNRDHWRYIGTFDRYEGAQHAAHRFQQRGFEISIRPF